MLRLPLGAGADSLHVFLEEPSARVRTGGLTAGPTQTIEQRSFRRWSGAGITDATIEVAFSSMSVTPGQVVAMLVAAAALAFAGFAALLLRRGRLTTPAVSPLALANRIARLDLRYAGREAEIAAEEWRRYQEDRARLREELARALAGRPRHS